MSNHVESLLSLSHVWSVPQAGAAEEERQPAAQKVRRAGSTCARWTVAEEQRLTEAVTELGERAWGDVASRINAENVRLHMFERSVSSVEQHWQVMTGRRQVKRPRQQSIAGMPPPAPAAALAGMPAAASAAALVSTGLNAAPPRPPGSAPVPAPVAAPVATARPTYPHQFTGTGEGEEVAIPNGGVARATSCAHWAPVDAPLTGEVWAQPPAPLAGGGAAKPKSSNAKVDWHLTTAVHRAGGGTAPPATAAAAPGADVVHRGGCHCGAVRFEVDAPTKLVCWDCNCSDCRMRRNLHFVVPRLSLRLIEDAAGGDHGCSQLAEYRWGSGVARHLFCARCGISPFYTPRSNPDGWAVTFQCLDAGTVDDVEVRFFDGQHWEDFIEAGGAAIKGFSATSGGGGGGGGETSAAELAAKAVAAAAAAEAAAATAEAAAEAAAAAAGSRPVGPESEEAVTIREVV